MKQLFILPLLYLGLLLITGCSGCKDDTRPTVKIKDQRLISAMAFDKGSYFIYKDSVTGELDSMYVTSYSHYTNPSQSSTPAYESVSYTMTDIQHSVLAIGSSAIDEMSTADYTYQSSYGMVKCAVLKFPFQIGIVETSSPSTWHYIGYYQIISVSNTSYSNVYELSTVQGADEFHTYYALESGLIKFKFTHNGQQRIWELFRQHIIRP